jgi:hypothetical protein
MTKRKQGKLEFARTICDATTAKGQPDMYNSVPKRPVPVEEARSHDWPHYFDGESKCAQGHIAARYVSNPYRCVDCARIADGRPPIYGKSVNDDLISAPTEAPAYLDAALRMNFRWDDEKWRQFRVAYVNVGDVTAALKLMGAQPNDLITLLRDSPEHSAEFDLTRRDVDQVFLWKAEGSAVGGDSRAMLSRAGAQFPDRFGTRGQSGLASEPYVSPDKAVAELAKLLRSVEESLNQQDALGAAKPADRKVAAPVASPTPPAADAVEEDVLLARALDASDLVSDP